MTGALAAVLDDHRRCRTAQGEACVNAHHRALTSARALVHALPLVHGTRTDTDLAAIVRSGALEPRADPPDAWKDLGTSGRTFTALAVLYPNRLAALIWKRAALEGEAHETTPWDSGRCWRAELSAFEAQLDSAPRTPGRRARFERYALQAPGCWDHVSDHIASSFDPPERYLTWWEHAHTWSDPLGALALAASPGGSPLLRSVEVRFTRPIPVNRETLAAVFLPKFGSDRDGLELRSTLAQWQVPVIAYEASHEELRSRFQGWIIEQRETWLKSRQGAP